jgi:hypothetical protein
MIWRFSADFFSLPLKTTVRGTGLHEWYCMWYLYIYIYIYIYTDIYI